MKRTKKLSIGQILTVSFPAVLRLLKNKHVYVSAEMNRLYKKGKVIPRHLGAVVEANGKDYEVEEVSVPMIWTKQDERRNPKENQKCAIVKSLIENAILSLDDLTVERIGKGKAVISKTYNYDLGQVVELRNSKAFIVKLYRAAAFIN